LIPGKIEVLWEPALIDVASRNMSDEFRRMERLCLEQAALSTMKEAREALEKVARDYHAAAEAWDRDQPSGP
jgi:hypothetical protein